MISVEVANIARIKAVQAAYDSKSSHLGSSLSCIDILSVLYCDIADSALIKSKHIERDRIILSKGHAALALYSVMETCKIFPEGTLKNFNGLGSVFLGHISHHGKIGIEYSSGSLGHGLPYGIGKAHAQKLLNFNGRIYVIISDGECDEGTTWESALIARHLGLDNLSVIIDRNRLQSIKSTEETLMLEPLEDKWKSFGWQVTSVDGHSHRELLEAFSLKDGPTCIIANTIKGKGISFMENNNLWHYKYPDFDQLGKAMKELRDN